MTPEELEAAQLAELVKVNENLQSQIDLLTTHNQTLDTQLQEMSQKLDTIATNSGVQPEPVTSHDYSGLLQDIKVQLENVQVLSNDILSVFVDTSWIALGCVISLVAFKTFYEGATKW